VKPFTAPARVKALTDDDLMPFGKYKGHPMREVEVGWLHWYFWEAQGNPLCPVMAYIRNNLTALKAEKRDLIWE
jgi:uncharacterized protein (DUF3820 family)